MAKTLEMTELILPSAAKRDAAKIVPAEAFEKLRFLQKLPEKVQEKVQDEGQQLAAAMMTHGASALAIGQHLSNLQELLKSYNCFYKFVRKFTRMNVRTVYRYMAGYQNAAKYLPEPILKAAMARGFRMIGDDEKRPLGVYTEAYRLLGPPPRNPDPEVANRYLDSMETSLKERRSRVAKRRKKKGAAESEAPEGDSDLMLREAYRFVSNRFKRLPHNSRSRRNWMEKFVGMLLADMGVSNTQTFEPTAVPEDFRAVRGRPSLNKSEAVN